MPAAKPLLSNIFLVSFAFLIVKLQRRGSSWSSRLYAPVFAFRKNRDGAAREGVPAAGQVARTYFHFSACKNRNAPRGQLYQHLVRPIVCRYFCFSTHKNRNARAAMAAASHDG